MLILGWILFGIALLALEAGILSLSAKSGEYVSPIGALRYNLLGEKTIPYSTWPWAQESATGILGSAFGSLGGDLANALNPLSGL